MTQFKEGDIVSYGSFSVGHGDDVERYVLTGEKMTLRVGSSDTQFSNFTFTTPAWWAKRNRQFFLLRESDILLVERKIETYRVGDEVVKNDDLTRWAVTHVAPHPEKGQYLLIARDGTYQLVTSQSVEKI